MADSRPLFPPSVKVVESPNDATNLKDVTSLGDGSCDLTGFKGTIIIVDLPLQRTNRI